ncbi:hypothetical protein BVRB_028270 [Beta vulgaris subsp. vulgaris]|uniref:non-specific serine/threonine protein kinase n=1 Tax=Beta vulgaris subsp. vulgaris TaxID=3555 RepID=A0A0J8B1K1_BETVV|nr:hypothetical protein BVRB_028270 [Beta vulgaris subsp. vulgaris]
MQRTTSTWLAADLNTYTRKTTPSCEHVLIKFARADVHYSHGIRREIQLAPIIRQGLEQARIPLSHSPLLRIHQDFRVPGIGGQQLAIIFERARCDLRSIMGQALPIVSVRLIARDMLRALDFMHRQCGIVHTDVNPSNIMLVADSTALQEGQYRDTIDEMYALEGYLFPLPV